MKRIAILAIGRDVSALTPGTPLYERLTLYDSYHTFIHVIMTVGAPKKIMIGTSVVVTAGGKSFIGAFFNALRVAFREIKKYPDIKLVTTQDVLYAGVVGYIVSLLKRKPLYVQLHGDYLDNPAWFTSKVGYGNRVMNFIGKWILRRADAIRVVSQRLLTQIVREQGIEESTLISIPIGTDLSIFSQTENRQRSKTLLFVGRLIPEKEPMLFVNVASTICKKYPDVMIGIAGDGFLKEEMVNRFNQEGLSSRVTFYGALAQRELSNVYAQSYCYIHTAGWEGWGMPMIESMAAGCPVVTTDSGCAGEAIRNRETGMVVPVNDEAGLVLATEAILNDITLWNSLVENGKKEAELWSLKHLAVVNMEWYASVK
ncbi:MAG: glycosyltransferase family 4 protein [Patescibacteria group bacterium]